jgi:hypothetical protein
VEVIGRGTLAAKKAEMGDIIWTHKKGMPLTQHPPESIAFPKTFWAGRFYRIILLGRQFHLFL